MNTPNGGVTDEPMPPDFVRAYAEAYPDRVTHYVKKNMPAMPHQWQPIETAPKDGTVILIAEFTRPVWSVVSAKWCKEWHEPSWDTISKHCLYNNPTHWMPLPPPPAPSPWTENITDRDNDVWGARRALGGSNEDH